MSSYEVPLQEVRRYSGLSNASLSFYVRLGLLPRPRVERNGRGTRVWYPPEVIGLLTVIMRLKRRGMKLKEIAQLIGQRQVIEDDEARALASAPISDDMKTVMSLGEELRKQLPDREVVMAIYDTEERNGERLMVPVKIVHLPKSWE